MGVARVPLKSRLAIYTWDVASILILSFIFMVSARQTDRQTDSRCGSLPIWHC